MVCGLSPRLPFDDAYAVFLERAAAQIAGAVVRTRALEKERRRAGALAEIDRAKTVFFANVSHEFRTPLALMLGPLEDLAASAALPADLQENVAVARRNGLRLLKLVNALLDFARIEAGRAEATFRPTDFSLVTAELASNFHSACVKAGLALKVDCARLPRPVYLDTDMWEKIVLNLVSNAFKFTLEGAIEVAASTTADGKAARLSVRDTGIGVPAAEMPRLFERFRRIGASGGGRSQEGSGIGLSLVRELVKLHGGAITAASEAGVGSVFTVTVPFGKGHLPVDRVVEDRSPAFAAHGGLTSRRRSAGCRGLRRSTPTCRPRPRRPAASPAASSSPTTTPTCAATSPGCCAGRATPSRPSPTAGRRSPALGRGGRTSSSRT